MNLYLAGTYSRPYVLNLTGGGVWNFTLQEELAGTYRQNGENYQTGQKMKLYLAGEHPVKNGKNAIGGGQILESYYYCRDNKWMPKLIPTLKGFLLDSGAFTFMQGAGRVDWDAYVEEYGEFINAWDIKLFFELDIDSIVGLNEVERLRNKLQKITGKYPIPVWHKSRGKDYFITMCERYPYVAIGGIVTQEIPRFTYEKAFPWFIREAHRRGRRIHGLGYTSIEGLHKYHFDSVDSTAWLYGNRGGYLYKFNARKGDFDKITPPAGMRLKSKDAAMNNYIEWTKFQQYAEKHL